MSVPLPHLPDFGGASITAVVPALTWGVSTPAISEDILRADRVVVLIIDSLGWLQLQERRTLAPNLAAMDGGAATTVAPSTTAVALTSISTGVAPGEHGIVGYRFPAGGAVMNALRWTTSAGDHRHLVSPSQTQPVATLAGGSWSVIGDRMFEGSGFSQAYLGDAPYHGIWHPSSLVAHTRALLDSGSTHIYTYYDGLDHTAHVYGFGGSYFDLELQFCDWLVGSMLDALPSGTALVVTADHGQVEAPEVIAVDRSCSALTTGRSGEARFRWLHAKAGAGHDLYQAAIEAHGEVAWVRTKEQVIEEGWFGPRVTKAAHDRLGDVCLVPFAPLGFDDPGEPHIDRLVGRHGSLTPEEMLVPILYSLV